MAVTIPTAVSPGDTVTLKCHYDLENDPLYTVKWYKGRQEFFRYIPKELPHTRVFPLQGVNVDVSKSGANEVVLRDVQFEIAGKYRCEVSADAPSFHTSMVASYMHVVYLPEGQPKMTMEKQRYSVGDTLRGNCSSPPSNPPTNLTWFVNDRKMNDSFPVRIPAEDSLPPPKPKQELIPENNGVEVEGDNTVDANGLEFPVENHERKVTVIGLELDIEGSTFQYGKMRIECRATMFQLYSSTVELVLDEEKPRLASVLGTRESSLGSYFSIDFISQIDIEMVFWGVIILGTVFSNIFFVLIVRWLWRGYSNK